MSRKPSKEAALPSAKLEFRLQRLRINRDGYDASGAYWGAGHDVFLAASPGGGEEITVRARNLAEARQIVAAELARSPGDGARESNEPLGGNASRKSRYEIEWRNTIANEAARIRITHSRDYLIKGTDHIEIESIKPKKAPLPFTDTGYRSHFLTAIDLINAGGPVSFVTAWLQQEAIGKVWRTKQQARSQGDLFAWADTNREIGKRRKAAPTKPGAKPRPGQRKDRAP